MTAHAPAPRSSLALRRITLFNGLSDAVLDRIAARCHWRQVEARTPLFTRDADGGEVFFLVAGRVRITTYSAGGRQVTFHDGEAGEHFGDLSALDGQPRSADVETLESALVASLPASAFEALLQEEPLLARRLLQHLAGQVRRLTERVIELSTVGVQGRLYAELLRLARAAGVQGNQALIAPAPSHAVLASKISTGREQVTRELNALVRQGLLRKQGLHAWCLDDVQGLQDVLAAQHDGIRWP